MNTPDSQELEQAPTLEGTVDRLESLEEIPSDSFLWVAEEGENLTVLRSDNSRQGIDAPRHKLRPGQQQTLYRQILLMLLPLVVIPFGMSGWMAVTKISQPAERIESVTADRQHEELWWQSFIALVSIGTIDLTIALWIARRLSGSFDRIATKLNEAANGNLLTQLEHGDNAQFQEVADNFNQLVLNFNRTLQQQGLTAQANKLFGSIALIAQESLDPVRAYNIAVLGVCKVLKVDRVSVYRCDPDWSGVVVAESVQSDYRSTLTKPIGLMYFAESTAEFEQYQSGMSSVIDDLERAQLSPQRRKIIAKMEAKSWMLFPIIAHNQLIGLLSIQQCRSVRHWELSEVDFCTQTAQRLGLAVEQIGTWTQQAAEIRRTNMLSQALQIRDADELTKLVDRALESIRQEFNLDRAIAISGTNPAAGEIAAMALKPGCVSIDPESLQQYVSSELSYGGDRPRQISNIYDIDLTGGLAADRIALLEYLPLRASMVAPIVFEGQWLGLTIGHMAGATREWQQSEIDKFAVVASQIGLALHQGKLVSERENSARRSQVLSNFTLQLRQSLRREDILGTAVELVRQTMDLDRAVVLELDADFNGNIVAESLNLGILSILAEQIEDCCIKDVGYQQGHITAFADIYKSGLSDCHIQMLEQLQVRANLVVPITIDDRLFGLLIGHQCQAPRQWQYEEIGLFTQLATQLALALNQSLLIEQRESAAKRSQLLSEITLKLRQSIDRTEILNLALPEIRQAFGVSRVSILLIEADGIARVVAESIDSPARSALGVPFKAEYLAEIRARQAIDADDIVTIEDTKTAGFNPSVTEFLLQVGIWSGVSVPISSGGKLLGWLTCSIWDGPRRWEQVEVDLIYQIAIQIGVAVNQSLLIEQRESAAKRSQLLSEITLKLRQSLDQTEILNIALPEVRQVFGVNRASIVVLDGDGIGKTIAESIDRPQISMLGTSFNLEHLQELRSVMVEGDKAIVINDVREAGPSESLLKFLTDINIRADLSTPIRIGDKFFGLLTCNMCDAPRIWEQSEIDLLVQISTQIGIALNQAQLVRQLEAANLQQAEFAASQQTARQSLQSNAWELLLQVDRISQGDLTIRARVSEDEIGTIADSYNATVENLRRLVTSVQSVSQEVVRTTRGNEISVAELSVDALQQAEEVGLALIRLQDMSSSIQLVVNNALIAESAMMESAQLVKDGDAAMNRTVEGILTIRSTVAETAKKVKRLGESSQKISKVVSLISNFAAQTNLLALNASIEAARAGEEGRGFAVVAEEVRSLARQSAEATGEIEKLVASIQAETNEVVTAMESGTEQVAIGTKLVDETRSSLNRIAETSAQIGALVEAIAQAALLQSENSNQVTQSIDRVATIANKTSSRADNVRVTFQDLLALARELQENIGQFKIE
jgi:methyl-accepting chemotaxis protein PixJ